MLSQEAVYAHVLGYFPDTTKRYSNPLRGDRSPGVFFRRKGNYLRMYDNGWGDFNNLNCFDLWNIWKRSTRICCGEDYSVVLKEIAQEINSEGVKIEKYEDDGWQYELTFKDKPFSYEELKWWLEYGITYEQLKQDDVYSVESYEFNTRTSDVKYKIIPQDLCFGYIVNSTKIHIYRPLQLKDSGKKWRTTVTKELISFPERKSDVLLIGNSYKDSRVMYNVTNFDVKARLSENMLPTEHEIRKMAKKWKHVIFIGDGDEAGVKNLEGIKEHLASLQLNNLYFIIPEYKESKDVADNYKGQGKEHSAKILEQCVKNLTLTLL